MKTVGLLGLLCWISAALAAPAEGRNVAAQQSKTAATAPKRASFEQLSAAADKAREENRDDEAIRLYREALALRPEWKQGLWYLGVLLYDNGQYRETRDLMRRFVVQEPKAGTGWAFLGLSEFETREYSRALDHLQRARSLGVGDREEVARAVFYYVSLLLTRFEHYDEAMSLLMAMFKSGVPSDKLVDAIGLAALRYPLLPTEIPPDRKGLFHLAGQAALAEASHQEEGAEKLLKELTGEYPNEPGVHFLYGAFLLEFRPEEGIQQLQKELEIAPYNFTAKLRLADQYLKQNRYNEAVGLAEEVIKVDAHYPTAYLVLGEARVAQGDVNQGIVALEKARQLRPETVRTHWDLLQAYASAGRTEDAKREKEEIEKLRRPETQQ